MVHLPEKVMNKKACKDLEIKQIYRKQVLGIGQTNETINEHKSH